MKKHNVDVRDMLNVLEQYGITEKNDNFVAQIKTRLDDPHGFISSRQKRILRNIINDQLAWEKLKAKLVSFKPLGGHQLQLF